MTPPSPSPLAPSTDRRLRTPADLEALVFTREGLIPVVAQDVHSGAVLMLAWATRDALEQSLATGDMTYWSRSREELWRKGDTSGHVQTVVSLHTDCDADAVLARVEQVGPACHTNQATCFGAGTERGGASGSFATELDALQATLARRAADRPEGSYTARLLSDENLRLKKLGEETAELIHALAKGGPPERIREEGADLLYHLLVALLAAGVEPDDLAAELAARRR